MGLIFNGGGISDLSIMQTERAEKEAGPVSMGCLKRIPCNGC